MAHTTDTLTALLPESIKRYRSLFTRFCHDLDGALERANEEYTNHMPSKGDVCEAALSKYLLETLGDRYSVITHGHIFDAEGNRSKEQDIVIFDDHWSGRFTPRDSNEPPILPTESVYATLEVKKTLSAKDLRSAINNIRSFKSLKREMVGPEYVTPNKRIQNIGFPGKIDERNPYYSIIFAFTTDRSPETILKQLKQETSNIPPSEWPDLVVLYKQGLIIPLCATCNSSANHINKILEDGHEPSYLFDKFENNYSLLGFHFLLLNHLHNTILVPPNLEKMYGNLAQTARWLEANGIMLNNEINDE